MSDEPDLAALYPSHYAAERATPPVPPGTPAEKVAQEAELRRAYPGMYHANGELKDKPLEKPQDHSVRSLYPTMFVSDDAATPAEGGDDDEDGGPEDRRDAADSGSAEDAKLRQLYPTMFEGGGAGGEEGEADTEPGAGGDLEIVLPESLPPGVQLDHGALKEYRAVAQEAGLSSDVASRLVAWDLQRQARAVAATRRQEEGWIREIETDQELGGRRVSATYDAAMKALSRHRGGEELYHELEARGLHNLPAFIRFLARLGAAIAVLLALSLPVAVDAHSAPGPNRLQTISAGVAYTVQQHADCGSFIFTATDNAVITLPDVHTSGSEGPTIGCTITVVNTSTGHGAKVSVSPHSSDGIAGSCSGATSDTPSSFTKVAFSGTADKDIINAKATADRGDFVHLISVTGGWYVVACSGVWASEP